MKKKIYMRPDFKQKLFAAMDMLSVSSYGEVEDDWSIENGDIIDNGDIF